MEQPQRRIYSETVRNPLRFQQRLLNQFNSQENYNYLFHLFEKTTNGSNQQYLLKMLWTDMQMFSAGDGPFYDFTDSDNVANRGSLRAALDLWAEVRRINLIFYNMRMQYLPKNNNGLLIPPPPPNNRKYQHRKPEDYQNLTPTIRDGISEDNEDFAMRMFISDSLQPPGMEYANGPGPNYEILENQSTWIRTTQIKPNGGPLSGINNKDQFNSKNNSKNNLQNNSQNNSKNNLKNNSQNNSQNTNASGFVTEETSDDAYDDIPWSVGNPNRSAEQAIAEYWGDNHVSSDTIIGSTEFAGIKNGDIYAWGPNWKKNGGSSFMRYPTIPFWQQGGREGIDYNIDETLGVGIFDSDTHVRRWDMDKLTKPRGQDYPYYGIRSGPVV